MNSKLHVDIRQGIIDVEGDPELIRAVYADFKGSILDGVKSSGPIAISATVTKLGDTEELGSPSVKQKTRRRVGGKKKPSAGESAGTGPAADAPKLDKKLDTSSLTAFFSEFTPKNNAEKILIFLKFLMDSLGIESPNTDQVYTCFKAVGQKIPKAYAQAFYDTSSKHGYIDFRSPTDFSITIVGDNHFNHILKRKTSE